MPEAWNRTAIFSIRAAIGPSVLLQLLNHFAQRDLVPARVRSATDSEGLQVTIEQNGMTEHEAEVVAAKMRNLVLVASVLIEHQVGRPVVRTQP